MIPLEQAQQYVLSRVGPLRPTAIEIGDALGLLTSIPLESYENVPPFDNTAVDGYAVIASDLASASTTVPVALTVRGTIPAGTVAQAPLEHGEAYRIMTGAKIPAGADAVVMVEDTEGSPDSPEVRVLRSIKAGDNIRLIGSDLVKGAQLFPSGTLINPSAIGVLASLGVRRVPVYPRPRVGVISTGSELTESETITEGMIRDSNRPSLLATLAQLGVTPIDLGLIHDDHASLATAFAKAASTCDAVVTTGGVSVGDFDLTKIVLDELSKGEMRWMQIAIRPAKPFAFGLINGTPLFGLPGNPVSALVSHELLAAPALRKMMGYRYPIRPMIMATTEDDFNNSSDRDQYSRVSLSLKGDGFAARLAGGQGSHVLSAMAAADGLLLVPAGQRVARGDLAPVLPLGSPWLRDTARSA